MVVYFRPYSGCRLAYIKGTPILGHAASVGAKYFAEDLGTDLMYMGEHDIFEVF